MSINSATSLKLTHIQRYKLLKFTQEEVDSLASPISSKEIKFIVKILSKK